MPRPGTKKLDVVDAALTLFMRKGIRATTTRDIAEMAGISEGTIYRHFRSKEELAEFVFEQNLEALWSFLKGHLKKSGNAAEMLQAFVEGIFEFSRKDYRGYSFIIAAHQTELKQHSREKLKPKNMLAKIIRLGQKQGRFRPVDPQLASAMLLGTIVQTIFYLRNGSIAVNYKNVVDEVALSCLKMVKGEGEDADC